MTEVKNTRCDLVFRSIPYVRTGGPSHDRAGLDVAAAGRGWVVGVEDFMRRFLPGRSNARSIIALAQLNGIVKYACQKVGIC